MARYEEHPAKPAAIRGGKVLVLPDAEAEDCTVWFLVDPAILDDEDLPGSPETPATSPSG